MKQDKVAKVGNVVVPNKPMPPGQVQKEVKISVEDLHIHIHVGSPNTDVDIQTLFQPLMDKADKIQLGVNQLMALSQESRDLLTKVDTVTTKLAGSQSKISAGLTEVASDITKLLAAPTGNEAELREALTEKVAVLEASAAAIDASADFLTQLGADTSAPVPALPPEVEPQVI